ncbi:MAG TPA: YhjD/YihY/BrkB family envelope integrity protein, partial [Candidatus Saccharimonadales bacterium]|nr:YhjD/YihY/BrkB family envelope integrity protein [Candidatus Saccharimonadales bacterium]
EDSAGRQAALLTYYTYLSLFPLLLILTTITDALVGKGSSLGDRIISGLTNYFPVLGNQLSQHVHSLNETGLALVIGVLFLLYGTRGVAEAFINGVQHIWMVSDSDNVSFYERLARSFTLVFIGGLGLLAASVLAGLTSTANHSVLFRLLSLLVNFLILFWLFRIVLNISLPRHISPEETRAGSAVAAIGLVVLQLLGGYIISHELKHLSALYSYFALSLGLLFWIYLQSQLIFYAIEIAIVKSQNLWPRSMDSQTPSKADRQLSDQVR